MTDFAFRNEYELKLNKYKNPANQVQISLGFDVFFPYNLFLNFGLVWSWVFLFLNYTIYALTN